VGPAIDDLRTEGLPSDKVSTADLASWQLNRDLLKFAATMSSTRGSNFERVIAEEVASLSQVKLNNFGAPSILNSLSGLDSSASTSMDWTGGGGASALLPNLPVSVTERGFNVGLLSVNSDGTSATSLLGSGSSGSAGSLVSGASQALSGVSQPAPVTQSVTGAASGLTSTAGVAVGQTVGGALATVRGIAR
jgi:hypothetical protein